MTAERNRAVLALAHPIRRQILDQIARGNRTPKGIADAIDEPLGVVSYHVRMLAGYGVLEVARTEPRRGALQHFYRVSPDAVEDLLNVRDLVDAAISSVQKAQWVTA